MMVMRTAVSPVKSPYCRSRNSLDICSFATGASKTPPGKTAFAPGVDIDDGGVSNEKPVFPADK